MSQEQVWRQFASEVGGEFVEVERPLRLGPFRLGGSYRVTAHVKQWLITLDTFTESSGGVHGPNVRTYTRMSAPCALGDGLRFQIYRAALLGELRRVFGMQDIEVGYRDLDYHFVIKGDDEPRVRAVLANSTLRSQIQAHPRFELLVDNGVHFREQGVIKDAWRLKSLLYIIAETLNELQSMGSVRAPGLEKKAPDFSS